MSQGYAPPPHGAPQFQAPRAAPPPPGYPTQPQRPGPQGYPQGSWTVGHPQAPAPSVHDPRPDYPAVQQPRHGPQPAQPGPTGPPQRPAVIALASTLAVLGSLQWICALSLLWVTATVGVGTFAQIGDTGALFHILSRFNARLLDGLAVPLYLFPLASLVTGFLVLSRRPWTRLVHTLLGLAALAWAAWWLQDNLLWWFSAAWYVVVSCFVLWTPGATAWYRWRGTEPTSPLM